MPIADCGDNETRNKFTEHTNFMKIRNDRPDKYSHYYTLEQRTLHSSHERRPTIFSREVLRLLAGHVHQQIRIILFPYSQMYQMWWLQAERWMKWDGVGMCA